MSIFKRTYWAKVLTSGALLFATMISTAIPSAHAANGQHVEFAYSQYLPNSQNKCERDSEIGTRKALQEIIFSWLAGKVVDSFADAASKRVKSYASERSSDVHYSPFYDDSLWKAAPVGTPYSPRVSCWEAVQKQCVLAAGQEVCPSSLAPRLMIRGQFILTDAIVKTVVTEVEITGLAPRRINTKSPASIAATMSLDAIWRGEERGYKDTIFSTVLFSKKINYSASPQVIFKLDSQQAINKAIEDAPPLPRVPQIDGLPTYAAVKITVAEASGAPRLLKWVSSFLSDKRSDLTDALAAALDKL